MFRNLLNASICTLTLLALLVMSGCVSGPTSAPVSAMPAANGAKVAPATAASDSDLILMGS